MNNSAMDRLACMEAFVRVATLGSFSAAARSSGLSKAAVSKYVAALEAHLGVQLLRRTTRSLSLTDAGRTYQRRCADLLEEIAALEGALRHDSAAPRGLLRVTAPPGLAESYGHVLFTEFRARYPEVRLAVDLTHRMLDLVEEGVDLAIRVTVPEDSTLVARHLAPAPIRAVAAPTYLLKRGMPGHPAALREHDCLIDTNFREQSRWRFVVEGQPVAVEVDGPFRVNSPATIKELAIAGHGIALIADFVVRDALADGRLVELFSGHLDYAWGIYAVYPRRRYLPARVRVFIEHLAGAFAGADQRLP